LKTLLAFAFAFGGLACGLVACRHEKPKRVYMPDMAYSPAFKAQEGTVRVPPERAIPVNFSPYPFAKNDGERAGRELRNPLASSAAVLIRGQEVFNTFCIVCHGPTGLGNGPLIPKFPAPPSLHTGRARGYPDGRIFHIITQGQNLMGSYASQIPQEDRWAVIRYLRVLQGKAAPVPPQQNPPAASGGGS